ncbi:MAG: cohesin domain-containing protein [Candidatus Zixiibacteriota bacterium]
MRCTFCIAAALLTCVAIVGCGDTPTGPDPGVALKLNIALETPALASRVRVVTLTVRYANSLVPDRIDTLRFVDGEVRDTISIVPADSVLFILRALDQGGVLLYEGSAARHVVPGSRLEVSILLRPAVLMLRVGPMFQTTTLSTENLVGVYIDVYNVDSLFGAAFRVRYDTTILRFAGATGGDFLRGTGSPGLPLLEFVKDTLDFVAYSVSRMREPSGAVPPGVSTDTLPGRLVSFTFAKVGAGTSELTLDATAVLQDRYGKPVTGHQALVLESATVRVE